MIHDDLQSLLGAYALDAVDADEVTAVEAHLAECPRCRSEVTAHRSTASLLASTGGEAPLDAWDRIAAEVALEDAPDDKLGLESPKSPKVVPFSPRRGVARPVVAALASAAAAAAALLGVNASRLDHRVNILTGALSTDALQQAAAAAILNPQHRQVQLTSTSNQQAAQIVILPDGDAYLVRSRLPALDSLESYQLWGVANGKIVSLGLLGSNPQVVAFRMDAGVSRLIVTAEPRGGVPQPTTPVLVRGDFPA